jgi:DNA polymerase V
MQAPLQSPPNVQTLDQNPAKMAQEPPAVELRLLSHRISAGFPSPATDYVEEGLDLNAYLVHNKSATFLFRVKGDSMTGAAIEDGDIIIVDRSRRAQHNAIVIAVVDGEYTVKRLYQHSGTVELRPENPAYSPIRFGGEHGELVIWGVVVGLVRRFAG